MATYYLDYEGGNDANDGLSFANRWKTLTSGATAARIAPGDTIRVMKSPDPTSLGINATWTNKSAVVTLASALNVLINDGEAAWTASANVTCTKDTANYRTGTGYARQQIAAGFTTGKVAYFGLGASNDYSAYQGITFWIRVSAALAASTLELRLCSDTTGDTAVDTFSIPAISVANLWVPIYIDKGAALGNAIQSISLHAIADPGTVDVYLDNISTVKAAGNDALNLQSLIGKNAAGETWWAIREINGTTIRLDQTPSMTVSNMATIRGYSGTSETVTTYKRETIKLALTGSSAATNHAVQDSGTAGNLIVFSGGWDRTSMAAQDGETWWDHQNGTGRVIDVNTKSYIKFEKISVVRAYYGVMFSSVCAGIEIPNGHFNHNFDTGLMVSGNDWTVGTIFCCSNGLVGFGTDASRTLTRGDITEVIGHSQHSGGTSFGRGVMFAGLVNVQFGTIRCHNNSSDGFGCYTTSNWRQVKVATMICNDNGRYGAVIDSADIDRLTVASMTLQNNASQGLYVGNSKTDNVIQSLATSGNGTAGIYYAGFVTSGFITILKSSIAEATKYTDAGPGGNNFIGRFSIHNLNGVAGDHRNWFNAGDVLVFSEQGADRHTASGLAWKISPKRTDSVSSLFPFRFPLAKLAVNASALVTVRAFVKRDNTGLTAKLVCRGGQIGGVSSDVVDTIVASAGVWEELEITFTPSEAGVVDIELHVYGGTTYNAWVDDMTVLQA